MNYSNVNIKDFINYIITFNNVDDILNTCQLPSEKGFIFERLFDIIIKFGFCDIFPNSNFNHLTGNSNIAKLKTLKHFGKYLDGKVISGKSGGSSDITLQNINDETFIFITSKYSVENGDNSKPVDYYDIQNIIAVATKNQHIYKKYKIYLIVANKQHVLDKVKNADITSGYITEHITDDVILDKDDLNKYFLCFKNNIIQNINGDWSEIYLCKKDALYLRFHQELITKKRVI